MTFKGKHHTKAYKRRMSKLFKGKKLKLSKESRDRMRKARLGKKLSKETIKKILKAKKGYKHSKETKLKISKANKGKKNGFYGKKHTKEARDKIRLSKMEKKLNKHHRRINGGMEK